MMPPEWAKFWAAKDRVMLAPMEGVVDPVMRDVLTRIGGIDLCVTEFIRVTDRVLPISDYEKYCPELFDGSGCRTRAGTPVLVQLLGGQPQPIAENAALACELGAPGIDLNFGCPAKTVNRHDGGASLLKAPQRLHDVTSAVRRSIPLDRPVSAKVRLGFEDKSQHIEIAQAAESGGAAWLTVHARTRNEGYRPPAHWEYVARMREAVKIPVIANGEVWTTEDYHRCREVSGSRHVMIGRGLMSSPFLALGIAANAPASNDWPLAVSWIEEFAELSRVYKHEHYAVCRTKQWLRSLAKHYPAQATPVFEQIKTFEDLAPILAGIQASVGAPTRAPTKVEAEAPAQTALGTPQAPLTEPTSDLAS